MVALESDVPNCNKKTSFGISILPSELVGANWPKQRDLFASLMQNFVFRSVLLESHADRE